MTRRDPLPRPTAPARTPGVRRPRIPILALGALFLTAADGCMPVEQSVTVRTAEEVTLDLPAVPNAPGRLEVMAYEPRPGAGPELGRCAPRLRDTTKAVDFHVNATQAWQDSETRGDTTFVRYFTIGDFIPVDLETYEMVPGQVVRVDCATYRVLGLADTR